MGREYTYYILTLILVGILGFSGIAYQAYKLSVLAEQEDQARKLMYGDMLEGFER